MFHSKDHVPKIYSKYRDYQAILSLLDIPIASIKHDTDSIINLLNPRLCPTNMLPLLAAYVGYEYDTNESVEANRTIIEYFPALIRNRGSEIGMTLATALSVNALANPDALDMLTLFHIEYIDERDSDGRPTGRLYIYVYYPNYLSKIRDLIEVVRPAGMIVELIPALQITAIEKIEIYDEWRSFGYEYTTGKLIRVDNHTITMVDDKIVNACYEIFRYSDDINIGYLSDATGFYLGTSNIIMNTEKEDQGYSIIGDNVISNTKYSGYKITSNTITATESDTTYDGYTIDSDNEICNKSGVKTGYFLRDSKFVDSNGTYIGYRVISGNIIGSKVGYIKRDINGKRLIYSSKTNETSGYYIGDRLMIMDYYENKLAATKYYINDKGNVVDDFGNVALSWIDRYHIADSHIDENGKLIGDGTSRIGFSEVANSASEGLLVDTLYYDVASDTIVSTRNGNIVTGGEGYKYPFRDNRDINILRPYHLKGLVRIENSTYVPGMNYKATIRIFNNSGFDISYSTSYDGSFNILVDNNGTYTIEITMPGMVKETYSNVKIERSSMEYVYDFGRIDMIPGDFDGDNILDETAIFFDTNSNSETLSDEVKLRLDLNRDTTIDLSDRELYTNSINKYGPMYIGRFTSYNGKYPSIYE